MDELFESDSIFVKNLKNSSAPTSMMCRQTTIELIKSNLQTPIASFPVKEDWIKAFHLSYLCFSYFFIFRARQDKKKHTHTLTISLEDSIQIHRLVSLFLSLILVLLLEGYIICLLYNLSFYMKISS